MEKEFNLSEKRAELRKELRKKKYPEEVINAILVRVILADKEFITRLKELQGEWTEKMNKLAGEKFR